MSRIVRSTYSGTVAAPVRYMAPEPNVYCPVCRMEYPQSQTDNHILRHTIQNVKFAK